LDGAAEKKHYFHIIILNLLEIVKVLQEFAFFKKQNPFNFYFGGAILRENIGS
jgi:hypothetical protein